MLVSFKGMSGPGAYAPGLFIFIKTRLYWAKIIILTLEGFNKMIKMIVKMFMPKPATLAKMAAKQI